MTEQSPTLAEVDINEKADLAQRRADSYRLLSRVWGAEVDEALWKQLQSAAWPRAPEAPMLDAAYRRLEAALAQAGPNALTDLAVDYARLCLGSDAREGADPYESVHRNREGLLMQDEWEQVLNLYAELGLARRHGSTELEDHLAVELECVAHLCGRAEEALLGGKLPEASWLEDQQVRLLDGHLVKWVPSFAKRVERLGTTEFYKSFAQITLEFLRLDLALLREGADNAT